MGRAPCCDKAKVKRGPWSSEEDAKLKSYVQENGTVRNWIALPQKIGLKRCGKSCRLRWLNYLRPNIKHGGFSDEEDNIICALFMTIGSRWSIIAAQLPGRTDNDIKNYWNTKLKKKLIGMQRKQVQEAAIQSNPTTTTTYPNNTMVKRENYTIPGANTHQVAIDSPVLCRKQEDIINITTSDICAKLSTILPFGEQLYDSFDCINITSHVNNYTNCFQLPNPHDFQALNNFVIDETRVYDPMVNVLPCGVDMVNCSGGNGTTTSAESTSSWGGDMNTYVCSTVGSTISYEDDYGSLGMCAFEDHQRYLKFVEL